MIEPSRRRALAALEGLLLSEATGLRLAELASRVPADQVIVEIGSFKGKSTCYLAEGAKSGSGARVVSIDPWDLPGNVNGRNEQHQYAVPAVAEAFARQVTEMGLEDRITHIQSFAADAAREWQDPIGMLFIDGSHIYKDVRRDYESFAPHLKPGATVVFDDYGTRNKGVTQFVDELRQGSFERWDMSTPPLAITRKPEEPAAAAGVRLSTVIMAHRKRERFIAELQAQLNGARVIWDRRNDRWDTGRRSMLAFGPHATHQLVVQDDAILCRDFLEGAKQAIAHYPDNPISFYTGSVRPHPLYVSRHVRQAELLNTRWVEMEGPWWGVAVAVPTLYIEEMTTWGDQHPEIANYDTRMSRFFASKNILCYYTVPSLVSHRSGPDNPSLVPGRGNSPGRVAINFIGEHRSALEIDWSGDVASTRSKWPILMDRGDGAVFKIREKGLALFLARNPKAFRVGTEGK